MIFALSINFAYLVWVIISRCPGISLLTCFVYWYISVKYESTIMMGRKHFCVRKKHNFQSLLTKWQPFYCWQQSIWNLKHIQKFHILTFCWKTLVFRISRHGPKNWMKFSLKLKIGRISRWSWNDWWSVADISNLNPRV